MEKRTILFYGDSNTYGYDPSDFFGGPYPAEKVWTSIVGRELGEGWTCINEGENGRRIPDPAGRYVYAKKLLDGLKETDVFAVMLGSNDLLLTDRPDAGLPIRRMEQFLAWILEREAAPAVLLIAPPHAGSPDSADPLMREYYAESVKMNEGYKELAEKAGVLFADASLWAAPSAYDEVHLSEEGHAAFAKGLIDFLTIEILLTHDTIEVNGVSIYYGTGGSGKPVILTHGNGESHKLFATQIRQLLSAGYRVYAPDSRGQGANKPLSEYHYADMAEDMFCFIQKLGLSKPAFYGFSDGGIIGLTLELAHPGTLALLAVSGANLSPAGLDPDFTAQFEGIDDPLIRLMFAEPDIKPADLSAIAIPVLSTAGSNDLILPEETRRIADSLPDCETVILEDADHGSYIVGSKTMGRLLLSFLQKHGY